jgi:hypothetical protein
MRPPTRRFGWDRRPLLASREGPAGWRALVAAQDTGPVAFWQPKR